MMTVFEQFYKGSTPFSGVIHSIFYQQNPHTRELADLLGFSLATLQRWGQGDSIPHPLVQMYCVSTLEAFLT